MEPLVLAFLEEPFVAIVSGELLRLSFLTMICFVGMLETALLWKVGADWIGLCVEWNVVPLAMLLVRMDLNINNCVKEFMSSKERGRIEVSCEHEGARWSLRHHGGRAAV